MCGRYPCRSIIRSICPYVRPLLYTNKCRIAKYKSKGVEGWGKEPEPLEPRHHHCDFTAKTQERPAGGPTSLLEMVVCHHLPFLGHKLGDHQRARDSLQRPSLEDACDLRGLSRYGAGPLDATTRASTQALWCFGALVALCVIKSCACGLSVGYL